MSKKQDSIADGVTDKEGSLSALAEPICPYMERSIEEDQQKHLWGIPKKSGGYQRKPKWTEIDTREENQH